VTWTFLTPVTAYSFHTNPSLLQFYVCLVVHNSHATTLLIPLHCDQSPGRTDFLASPVDYMRQATV